MRGLEATLQSTVHWVGMDVAKETFDAALFRPELRAEPVGDALRRAPVKRFKRTQAGARSFLKWLDGQLEDTARAETVRVCMEATGKYSTQLATWLLRMRADLGPAIINPRKAAAFTRSLGMRNSTDKQQACVLGLYGAERRPAAYQPPSPVFAELRELSRYRDALIRDRTAEKNRAEIAPDSKRVRQMQQRRLNQFDRDIKKIDEAIEAIVDKTPELAEDAAHLKQIHGVGRVTAAVVLAELGDLRRFRRARQLTAFAGLSPRIVESGTSVHYTTHICKQGNSRVRQTLYLAAMAAIRKSNDLKRTYDRLVAKGKPGLVALCAVMRKMLCVMRAMLISGKPYKPSARACG